MKSQLRHSIGRAALCAGLFACPTAAFAQSIPQQAGADETIEDTTAPDAGAQENTIVVTGSLIRGTPEDAALPVDVFTAEDLSASGVDSPLEFIKELPSVGAVLGDTNQFSTSAQGFQGVGSINLRGLDSTRTLVLLNSKRTIQSPGAGFADTNLIPLFALDRIEILKDGAAATYGSDAIAGVANFVTRRDFEGFEVQGDYRFIDGSDGNYSLSGLAGFDFANGDGNLMIGAGWQHRSELPTTARDYTQLDYATNPSGYSALSTPGLFAVSYFIPGTGVSTQVRPDVGCDDLGGFQDGAVCRYTYIPFDNITEDEDRYQVYVQGIGRITDRMDVTIEALWARSDVESLNYSPAFPPTQGPRGSGFQSAFTTSPNNPGVGVFLDQVGLPQSAATAPIVAVTNVLLRPFGFLGNPLDPERGSGTGAASNDAWRISGGIDYRLTDALTLDVDATYWESERYAVAPGIIGSRLQAALNGFGGADCDPATTAPGTGNCYYFNPFANAGPGNPALGLDNPFYVPGNENDPELLRYLQIPNGTIEDENQIVVDAVVSGELGLELPGGEVAFAVGTQYRRNEYSSRPVNAESNALLNPCFIEGDTSCVGTTTEGVGPFIFLGVFTPVDLDQSVVAAFAEVNLPLAPGLELDGAIRFEDYGDPIGSTVNPKASVRFEATDFLTLRGSIGTTFRGPLASNVSDNFVTALQGFTAAGGNYKSLDIYGNPDNLGPETALTYNVGAILDTGPLTFSVDYWSINLEDRITTTPGDAIANLVVSGDVSANGTRFADCSNPLADLVTFAGDTCVQGTTTGLDISRVRTDFVNGPDVKISGLDFALNYDIELGSSLLSLGGNAVWNLDYEFDDFFVRDVLVEASYDAVGFGNYFRDPNTVPEWRANAYANLALGALNARYGFQYIDGVFDDRCVDVDPCFSTSQGPTDYGIESGSYTQHNFYLTYTFEAGPNEFELQAAVENFTDNAPAEAQLPLGYNPFIGNAIGRNFRIGLRARF